MFSPSGFYDAIANTLTGFLKSLFLKLILEQLFLTLPCCLAFKVKLKNLMILEGMKLITKGRNSDCHTQNVKIT